MNIKRPTSKVEHRITDKTAQRLSSPFLPVQRSMLAVRCSMFFLFVFDVHPFILAAATTACPSEMPPSLVGTVLVAENVKILFFQGPGQSG